MAIKIVRVGNVGSSNDHNLLINRGERDQHPIEAITGLKAELNSKYTTPDAGIPRKDLSFPAATVDDVHSAKVEVQNEVQVIRDDVTSVTGKTDALQDYINNNFDENGNPVIMGSAPFSQIESIFEQHITTEGQTIFNLNSEYAIGSNRLKVFRDGVLLNIGTDYNEVTSLQVELTPTYENQIVTFIQDHRTGISSPIHEERIYDGSSSVFEISPYRIGDHSLSIYLTGRRLDLETEYNEIDNTHVEVTTPLQIGDKLIFRRETHLAGKVQYHDEIVKHSTWTQKVDIDTEGVDTISLDKAYIVNTGMLYVYNNGLLMDIGPGDDYQETDGFTIKFNYPLDVGDRLRIVCDPTLSAWTETFVITSEVQKVIHTSNSYTPSTDDIQVYYDGILLEVNEDYEETNLNTITFPEVLDLGSKIKIYKRR